VWVAGRTDRHPRPASAAGKETRVRPKTLAGGRYRLIRRLTPWAFLAVPLTLLLTFSYVPVGNLFYYSITNWDGFSPQMTVIGLRNYQELFTNPERFEVFFVSLFYLAAAVVQLTLALYFATVLSYSTRFRNLFKGLIFFPYLLNGVAVGFVFLYFFQPGGVLDSTLNLLGVHSQQLWLGDPNIDNWSLASVSVWRYLGLNFVLFLGAIQSIPGDLYQAAELDGANRWHQFRYLILPGIRPVVGLSCILAISGSLSVFEVPYIMTGGSNNTKTFVIQTVKLAFDNDKFGLASAAAVVLLAIVLLVTWIARRVFPDGRVDLA
jgi:multiple sugar transport system permease protein